MRCWLLAGQDSGSGVKPEQIAKQIEAAGNTSEGK